MNIIGNRRRRIFRRPRFTIRARLTLTYAGLVIGCGIVLIATVWVFMRFVPYYAIGTTVPDSSVPSSSVPASKGTEFVGSDSSYTTTVTVRDEGDFLRVLLLISLLALIVLVFFSGFIGWIVAGRVLKPLKAINEAATIASTGSFDHRVGMPGPRDEISDLSNTFDNMLSALGRSFDAHRRFAANASHELRTPIATTKTMIDVGLADPDADVVAFRALLERIRIVNGANGQTVEALLDLADITQRSVADDPVNVHTVTEEVIADAHVLGQHKQITIVMHTTRQENMVIAGDAILIRQCITNLVHNAITHNHQGGSVDVFVMRHGSNVEFRIANTGSSIPGGAVEALLEPFVRGTGRNAISNPERGRGLGLAIAVSIVEAHHGSLRLHANPCGGLTATLRLSAVGPTTPLRVNAP